MSHPAFGYFCEQYHLKQLSIESEGKEPRPQDVTQVLNAAKQLHVQAVLLQPQYSNKGAQSIAEILKLPVFTIDPYAWNYPQTIHTLADAISQHDVSRTSD